MRAWNSYDVMQFCINHKFYTCGDNVHYDAMLDYVRKNKTPLFSDIRIVAADIVSHSDNMSIFNNNDVNHMVAMLLKEVVIQC